MAKLKKREVAGSRNAGMKKSVHMAEWCYSRIAETWNGWLNGGIKKWRNGEMDVRRLE